MLGVDGKRERLLTCLPSAGLFTPAMLGRHRLKAVHAGLPEAACARQRAPILLIMIDDVGFSARSCSAEPDLRRLIHGSAGQSGWRATRSSTRRRCARPTRAALPHRPQPPHQRDPGVVMELGTGYPGQNRPTPKSSGMLRPKRSGGTATTPAWNGKNEDVPHRQLSQGGALISGRTALGFEQLRRFHRRRPTSGRSAPIEGIKLIGCRTKQGPDPRKARHGRQGDRAHPPAACGWRPHKRGASSTVRADPRMRDDRSKEWVS